MKLYLISLGMDTHFDEKHRYLFRVAASPREALLAVLKEMEGENFHFDSLTEINYADGRRIEVGKPPEGEFLFSSFVGYYIKGEPVERHGIIFVVASDSNKAKEKVKGLLKTLDAISPHVDGLMELKEIGGYPIATSPGSSVPNLFLYHDEIKKLLGR